MQAAHRNNTRTDPTMKADSPKCHSILAVIRTEFTRWGARGGVGSEGAGWGRWVLELLESGTKGVVSDVRSWQAIRSSLRLWPRLSPLLLVARTFCPSPTFPPFPNLSISLLLRLPLLHCLFYSIRFFGSVLHEVFHSFSIHSPSHTSTHARINLAHCFSLSLLPHATKHTRILRYKGCLCECAIDAASLMYYPKKRNVCIAYAGF